MQEDKNKVEAILFTTGRFIGLDEISKMTGIASVGYLKEVLFELVKDYKNKNCSLEITQQVDKWKLNIRKEYLPLIFIISLCNAGFLYAITAKVSCVAPSNS